MNFIRVSDGKKIDSYESFYFLTKLVSMTEHRAATAISGPTRPCLIACGILKEEIEKLIEGGQIDADPCFLKSRLHSDYGLLESTLTAAIQKHKASYPNRVIVVYGDLCLGFNDEMKALMAKYDVVKVNALNCIDCQLGGGGKLLDLDPDHKYLYLNPAFIEFSKNLIFTADKEAVRKRFAMLEGIILLDPLGNLDDYMGDIDRICDDTGLPVLDRINVGLEGLKAVIGEAINRLLVRMALYRFKVRSE